MDTHTADRDALVDRYRPYARALAVEFIGRLPAHVDKNDVIGYAHLGLVEAATTFNPSAGVHFKTFAYYRIRGAIYDGLRQLGGVPRELYRQLKFERAANAYLEDYSTQAPNTSTTAQFEELKGISGSILNTYLLSLDMTTNEPVASGSSVSPQRNLEMAELAIHLRDAINRLPEKNRHVIEQYYFHDCSLEEIAKKLNLSKSWVCRLHARGIDLLRGILAPEATLATAAR